MKTTGNELWSMELFEERRVMSSTSRPWLVTRVPGGWVMREEDIPSPAYAFVPLDNEFQS
jgi:hypothetical protein